MYGHMVLKCLSIDSGIPRRFNSGFPKSMHRASMLQARACIEHVQMTASSLSSTNTFLLVPRLPFTLMLLLMLSVVACTTR